MTIQSRAMQSIEGIVNLPKQNLIATAALLAGLGLMALAGTKAQAAEGCYSIGGGKYNCFVWKTATSYFGGYEPAGKLYAGWNYFYCQAVGKRMYEGNYYNVWYGLTDDDNGNRGVWVNAVYMQGGGNDEPVPGLPGC